MPQLKTYGWNGKPQLSTQTSCHSWHRDILVYNSKFVFCKFCILKRAYYPLISTLLFSGNLKNNISISVPWLLFRFKVRVELKWHYFQSFFFPHFWCSNLLTQHQEFALVVVPLPAVCFCCSESVNFIWYKFRGIFPRFNKTFLLYADETKRKKLLEKLLCINDGVKWTTNYLNSIASLPMSNGRIYGGTGKEGMNSVLQSGYGDSRRKGSFINQKIEVN